MDAGRAHIEFLDQTHVFLAQNTLIVVYGTAGNTRVSKIAPTIELQAGEVQAGLSALRGEPALVALPEGGQVSALSHDTVVERKSTRTTVAVFEGRASVASGGKNVTVPKDFGTRFVGTAPPDPPRPLPPAPHWEAGGSSSVVLAPAGTAVITTKWTAVAKAKSYRLEVSRDEGFHDLVVREEIPADTLTFRAERFPAATYHVRVRAIDTEEYLGIASDIRTIEVVAAELHGEGSRVEGGKVFANPYGTLTFDTQSGLQLSLDNGPFGAIPQEIDLLRQTPHTMRIRTGTGKIENIAVEYTRVTAEPTASFDPSTRILNIRIKLDGTREIDVMQRITPRLRARMGARSESVPLVMQPDKTLIGSFAVGETSGEVQFDVTDERGHLLGTNSMLVPEKPVPAPAPHPVPRIGLKLPPPRPAGMTGLPWSSPTAPTSGGIGVARGVTANGTVLQGNVRASGAIGRWGFDAYVETPPLEPAYPASADYPANENAAWLGTRYRVVRRGDAEFEFAPVLRIGLPMVWHVQPFRFDVGVAFGGVRGRMTWLVNAGGLFAAGGSTPLVPRVGPYVVAGGTVELVEWFRAYAALDVHLMIAADGRHVVPFGLSGGIEIGRSYFVSLGGWVGRAESVELKPAATGLLSLGIHLNEVTP
jgi:hypothetical protein